MRRISGNIDFDLRRGYEHQDEQKRRTRRSSNIPPAMTSKVNRMNQFDDYIADLDSDIIKCATIVQSDQSASLMDREYRKIRYDA